MTIHHLAVDDAAVIEVHHNTFTGMQMTIHSLVAIDDTAVIEVHRNTFTGMQMTTRGTPHYFDRHVHDHSLTCN